LNTSQNQARVNSGWHAIRGVGVALGGGVFGPNPVWTDKAAKVVRGLAKGAAVVRSRSRPRIWRKRKMAIDITPSRARRLRAPERVRRRE